jgi:hypothetical protein
MEASNGYEYKVVKVRPWSPLRERARDRVARRASQDGWEVVNSFEIEGLIRTPVLVLKRPAAS